MHISEKNHSFVGSIKNSIFKKLNQIKVHMNFIIILLKIVKIIRIIISKTGVEKTFLLTDILN